MQEWLLSEPNARLQIIFKISENDNDDRLDVIRHLIILYQTQSDIFTKALGEWYDIRNYTIWSKKYPLPHYTTDIEQFINAQFQWCSRENISITPLVLVNGYQMPRPYGVETLQVLYG